MGKYSNSNQTNNKLREILKRWNDGIDRNKIIIYVGFILAALVVAAIMGVCEYFNPEAEITDDYIKRPYSQLLRFLDEEPENISSEKYEEVIPNIVQKDIQKMLDSNGELSILYYGEDNYTYIKIWEDDEGIYFAVGDKEYSNDTYARGLKNVSMYKSGHKIIIFGSQYGRRLYAYEIENGLAGVSRKDLEQEYIDLCGANVDYEEVRYYGRDMILVKNGNDFMFYRFGEQVGKTEHFPGGEIKEINYDYILDNKNDLYYLYYCAHPDNAWIKFIKVDTKVSAITEEFITVPCDGNSVQYPIYEKNGKRYAGIANANTENAYGQNYGSRYDTLDVNTIDFNITTVELKADVSSITLNRREAPSSSISMEYYDWYIRYNYADGTAYTEERINGLDSYLTKIIPEEEMQKFEGKEVKAEQLTDVINELKQLYDKFSR